MTLPRHFYRLYRTSGHFITYTDTRTDNTYRSELYFRIEAHPSERHLQFHIADEPQGSSPVFFNLDANTEREFRRFLTATTPTETLTLTGEGYVGEYDSDGSAASVPYNSYTLTLTKIRQGDDVGLEIEFHPHPKKGATVTLTPAQVTDLQQALPLFDGDETPDEKMFVAPDGTHYAKITIDES